MVKSTDADPKWKGRVDPERIFVTGYRSLVEGCACLHAALARGGMCLPACRRFSMGCMMAHRFAMERGKLVAGVGCHGGELNLVSTNVDSEETALKVHVKGSVVGGSDSIDARLRLQKRFDIQPMPVVMTIGTKDGWRSRAVQDFHTWVRWRRGARTMLISGPTHRRSGTGALNPRWKP